MERDGQYISTAWRARGDGEHVDGLLSISSGWFPSELDNGHLDYYFLLVATITLLNFAIFVALPKTTRPRGLDSWIPLLRVNCTYGRIK